MKKDSRARITFSEENQDFLSAKKAETNLPTSQIVDFLISQARLNNLTINKSAQSSSVDEGITQLDFDRSESQVFKHEIKIFLTPKELNKLNECKLKNCHCSIRQEARFRLLNTLYNEDFISKMEITLINNYMVQLHKIGTNINQVTRQINRGFVMEQQRQAFLSELREGTKLIRETNEIITNITRASKRKIKV